VVAETKKPVPAARRGGGEPMDMMSALKARVEMRRKAMTGKQTIEKKEEPSDAPPKLDGDGEGVDTSGLPPGARIKPQAPAKAPATMSTVVLAAMIDSHKKKEAAEEDTGEWD